MRRLVSRHTLVIEGAIMKTRPWGRTDLTVSEIGLGGVSFPSRLHSKECIAVIHRALDLGINLIDTAPGYKDSESIIGDALYGGPRKSVVLSSKYYPYTDNNLNLDAGALFSSVEESLRRLRTHYLDLLHFHWVHNQRDVLEIASSPLIGALEQLKVAGKVRHVALSEASEMDGRHDMLNSALATAAFEGIMVTYNIFLQTARDVIFPMAFSAGKGIVVMMPLNQPQDGASGLLGRAQALENVRRLIEQGQLPDTAEYRAGGLFAFLASSRPDLTIPQVAIRFVLDRNEVSSVLVGTRSIAHLEDNFKASSSQPLSSAIHDELTRLFSGIETHVK